MQEGTSSEAIISAAPQIRDLQKESLALVPTHLRVHRTQKQVPTQKKKKLVPLAASRPKETKTTDEAYAEFMAEIDGL